MAENSKILAAIKQKPYFQNGNFVLYLDDYASVLSQLVVDFFDYEINF